MKIALIAGESSGDKLGAALIDGVGGSAGGPQSTEWGGR